jgi:hypothetical protein
MGVGFKKKKDKVNGVRRKTWKKQAREALQHPEFPSDSEAEEQLLPAASEAARKKGQRAKKTKLPKAK